MKCRHCNADADISFVNLGSAPPSNAYLSENDLHLPEIWYPLRVVVCGRCWLVQTHDAAYYKNMFSPDYAYFSSYSTSWLRHSESYVAEMTERFSLNAKSLIVEVAANDGYLLQFAKAKGIPCLGIEPTAGTASAARAKGLTIVEEFFGVPLARRLYGDGQAADLMVANNVLAHVPDINDFVAGFSALLKPEGVATFEAPHLMNLVNQVEFDTIYHEHFSYLSLCAIETIFEHNGLNVFDVQELSTHGGSLRVFAQRSDKGKRERNSRVDEVALREERAGMKAAEYYSTFQSKADKVKNDFLGFLLEAKLLGKVVVGYGAAAKGNTLMNYAGVRPDLIEYVVDKNPAKQGKFMPGSRIPIVQEARLRESKPDLVVIFPWNLKGEIVRQLAYIRDWGGKFVIAIPELKIE